MSPDLRGHTTHGCSLLTQAEDGTYDSDRDSVRSSKR